jgi:hypothetical protein
MGLFGRYHFLYLLAILPGSVFFPVTAYAQQTLPLTVETCSFFSQTQTKLACHWSNAAQTCTQNTTDYAGNPPYNECRTSPGKPSFSYPGYVIYVGIPGTTGCKMEIFSEQCLNNFDVDAKCDPSPPNEKTVSDSVSILPCC